MCGIVTSVDWDEPVQPPVKLSNFKCCLVSSLPLVEYSYSSSIKSVDKYSKILNTFLIIFRAFVKISKYHEHKTNEP